MGHVPVEVLLQIIQAAVDTIPIPDLLAMRLVNTFFANEIMTLLIQSPRLEDDGLGFAHEHRFAEGIPSKNWWTKFPPSYKRQYLHQKVKRHPTSPCAFSTIIHELLAIPHAPRTKEQDYILIDKLIDAWLCGRFLPYRNVYDPRLLSQMNRYSWEPVERTMAIALTTSAIIRGDCEELQRNIDAHDDPKYGPLVFLWDQSDRFGGIRLVDIGGLKGSMDAIRLLIVNDPTNEDLAARVGVVVIRSVRIQRPDVAEFIEKEGGLQVEKSGVMFDMFMEGIVRMRLSQVHLYLNCGGFDINLETERFRYGPLHGATYAHKGIPDLQLVTLLLKRGANPNKVNPTTRLTLLQVAVERGHVVLAKLLIEYGADINASRFFQKRKSRVPLIHVAVEKRSAPMIRLLLENGLDREYLYRGRKIEIRGDTAEGDDNGVGFQRKMQEVMKPIDEKGYLVLMGDKLDKRQRVVGRQGQVKKMSTGVVRVFIK